MYKSYNIRNKLSKQQLKYKFRNNKKNKLYEINKNNSRKLYKR